MKMRSDSLATARRHALCCLAGWLCLAPTAGATTYTWPEAGNTPGSDAASWTTGTSWQGGTVPANDLSNTDLIFGPRPVGNVNLDRDFLIRSLTFANDACACVFNP